jgi:hypothetical protein
VSRFDRGLRAAAAPLLALLVLSGCSNFQDEIKDNTVLDGPARGDLGRELGVAIVASDQLLERELVEAVAADLEHGDLFDEVHAAHDTAPVTSGANASRLDVRVRGVTTEVVHDFWRQRDGFVARYELGCALTDRTGTVVLSGQVTGLGYDDVTDTDNLFEGKREDIRAAARRDAAVKIGRALRRAAAKKADEALQGLAKIHLPPGVGPVRVAVLGFDDDPAARRRRGVQMTRALAGALQRLGPDLEIVSPEEVETELGSDADSRPASFENLKSGELDRMIPRLGMRFYVVGKVSADGNRAEAEASLRPTQESAPAIGVGEASFEGPGALSLAAVEIARQLGAAIERNPPAMLPKRDDMDQLIQGEQDELERIKARDKEDKDKSGPGPGGFLGK